MGTHPFLEMVTMGTPRFDPPSFSDGTMEIRVVDDEVCIYATSDGLRVLVSLCEVLLRQPKKGHLHLEDFSVLTSESLRCTLAIFKQGIGACREQDQR